MADTTHGTAIEWTHIPGAKGETWNPIRARNIETGGVGHFCVHVDGGCKNCYAERLQVRFKNPVRYAAQDSDKVDIFLDQKALEKPLRWKAPRTIFVCSMTDLFADFVEDEWLDKVFAVAALCPRHIFIVLTKRPERMREYDTVGRQEEIKARAVEMGNWLDIESAEWPLPNVWLGTSVSDQDSANERIPHLLATPAAIRFVSYEPALGPVDFNNIAARQGYASNVLEGWVHDFGVPMHDLPSKLDWIIAGGESGPHARPAHPDWFRNVRDQCDAAGVPFFFKQWGEFTPGVNVERQSGHVITPDWFNNEWSFGRENLGNYDGHIDDEPVLYRVGKSAAGAMLDGREHREFPQSGMTDV